MNGESKKRSLLVVLSGPSGVGKDTLRMGFIEKMGFSKSVSCTTRKQGVTEVEGKDYFFITKEDFENRISRNELLEYDKYGSNYYGTLWKTVRDYVEEGESVIFALTIPGAIAIKKAYPEDAVSVFILPPDVETLETRIRTRARGDSEESIKERMYIATHNELPRADEFDYKIVNDDFDKALNELCEIIRKEKINRGEFL